jgi:iron donor protein CyaY
MQNQKIDEVEFRKAVHDTFSKIQTQFDEIDPDLAECVFANGTLSITFKDKSKLILSTQSAVKQLWCVDSKTSTAYHFNLVSHTPNEQKWFDDKTNSLELFSYLNDLIKNRIK